MMVRRLEGRGEGKREMKKGEGGCCEGGGKEGMEGEGREGREEKGRKKEK